MAPLAELTRFYDKAQRSRAFRRELTALLNDFAGRPTPLYFAERLSEQLGGARIFLKREDLLHTGAHKINNALGQCLLTKLMEKERVIAETGAGQHGVATATAAAALGLTCTVYIGSEDMRRQRLHVDRLRLLCPAIGEHAARCAGGALGVLHGTRTFVLQDEEGQISTTHSVSAGLDYPAIGPEHVWLHDARRVEYSSATDAEAIAAFHLLARTEGILPALESAHAIAEVVRLAPRLSRKRIVLVNLSGRGDKDVESVIAYDREHAGHGGEGEEDGRVESFVAAAARRGR